jgi:hypothetical protein
MRRWRERHASEHAASNRAYYERHKQELAPYFAQYRREHRDVRQGIHARRRARKLGAVGSYMTAEWIELVQRWNWTGAYCGERGRSRAGPSDPAGTRRFQLDREHPAGVPTL